MPEPNQTPKTIEPLDLPDLLQADDEADLPAPGAQAPQEEPANSDPMADQRPPPWALVPAPHGQGGGKPEWPKGGGFPKGVKVYFAALPVAWMRRKEGGSEITVSLGGEEARPHLCRQVIFWELDIGDTRLAFRRAQGDVNQASEELARQMIRAVDGRPVVTGNPVHPDSIERFWQDIGPQCRSLFQRLYTTLHHLGERQLLDFFGSCLAARNAAS